MIRYGAGNWSEIETWGQPGEVAWQISVFNGTAYASSYMDYSTSGRPNISAYLNMSHDGWNWMPCDPGHPTAYRYGLTAHFCACVTASEA